MTDPVKKKAKRQPAPCEWYTAEDLASLLGISVRCVWRWSSAGRLPAATRLSNKCTRWRKKLVDDWIASMTPESR